MENLNGLHPASAVSRVAGGVACTTEIARPGVGGVVNMCHTPNQIVNVQSPADMHVPDHAAVTVTVGGPILHHQQHRGSFSNSIYSSNQEINLNASATIVTSDCCSNVMSCEETKQLLAKHLEQRSRCCHTSLAYPEENFDGIDLGGDDQTPVPLGDILDKLQEETAATINDGSTIKGSTTTSEEEDNKVLNDFIRLHSVENEHPTISATVNVATLDLSDPESIHQHLSQLNDTVLRVSTADQLNEDNPIFETESTRDNSNNQATTTTTTSDGSNPTKISISSNDIVKEQSSTTATTTTTSKTSPLTISSSSTSSSSTPSTPTKTSKNTSPATVRKTNASGSKASPQSCSVCSKVFSNASALAKHRLTHSEERRYHCNICGKAFKRQDHLNGHLLTHRSTKPFACHVEGCGKSYCDARSLRRHKENHHGQAKPDKSTTSSTNDNQSSEKSMVGDTIVSGPEIISKASGDTKIKFSSKGLTAQQLQLIEQLFKQSKTSKTSTSTTNSTNSSVASTGAEKTSNTTSNVNKKTTTNNSEKPLPDKPVECTICSRKFKNIPALNGHMRLHGGYYKKDADGRRMVGMANTSPLKTMGSANLVGTKRKPDQSETTTSGNSNGANQNGSPPNKKCLTPTISVTYCQPQVTSLPSTTLPTFSFSNLPQPDTSKLLANLEQKAKEMTTTSTLRALRKQPSSSSSCSSASSTTTSSSSAAAAVSSAVSSSCTSTPPSTTNVVASVNDTNKPMMNTTQPLLPLVALPTKPLPVQITPPSPSTSASTIAATAPPTTTSIQITALIHSNSSSNQFMVQPHCQQTSSQNQDLMSSLNMLGCMQSPIASSCIQQQPSCTTIKSQKASTLLKVDDSTDKTPKIGADHQAIIPSCQESLPLCQRDAGNDRMPIWDPDTANCLSDFEMSQYLLLASSVAVGGGSHNEEIALEILQKHHGQVQPALQELLSSFDCNQQEEDAMSILSSDSDEPSFMDTTPKSCWQSLEVDLFYEGMVRYHKDFTKISNHVGSKSVKECVEFYYLWKNMCVEESQSFKSLFSQSEPSDLMSSDQ